MRIPWHSKQAVVALGLALGLLLDLENADDAASEDDPWEGRCVVHDHNIDGGVAVVGLVEGTNPQSCG